MASLPHDNPRYSDIAAAVRKLLKGEIPYVAQSNRCAEQNVRDLVDYLALMGNIIKENDGNLTLSTNYRPATKEMVLKELLELEQRANELANKIDRKGGIKRARDQLAKHIRNLHQPTILALSESPQAITPYFVRGLPDKLEGNDPLTSAELRFWARTANLALVEMHRPLAAKDPATAAYHMRFPDAARVQKGFRPPATRNHVGRPQNRRAQNVADELARQYSILTGKRPTITVIAGREGEGTAEGPFLNFTREIFALLDINHNALHYARTAAHKHGKK